jgi:hypothetical protein
VLYDGVRVKPANVYERLKIKTRNEKSSET